MGNLTKKARKMSLDAYIASNKDIKKAYKNIAGDVDNVAIAADMILIEIQECLTANSLELGGIHSFVCFCAEELGYSGGSPDRQALINKVLVEL